MFDYFCNFPRNNLIKMRIVPFIDKHFRTISKSQFCFMDFSLSTDCFVNFKHNQNYRERKDQI